MYYNIFCALFLQGALHVYNIGVGLGVVRSCRWGNARAFK